MKLSNHPFNERRAKARKAQSIDAHDLIVVGGGPAGMAAALGAHEAGIQNIVLFERDQFLGGILQQCIHVGFGVARWSEALTGPEYADTFIKKIYEAVEIQTQVRTFVVDVTAQKTVTYYQPGRLGTARAKAIILATGCREKTREMIHIPGTRPAGVFSAGLAQKLINSEGLVPGKEIVVVGSGDIGLIMARRFTLEGARVKAVIEIQPIVRGLRRNVVQCLEDFNIPLYMRHTITGIYGADRVEAVDAAQVDDGGVVVPESKFRIACDTVLISVGLVPENELAEKAGVLLDVQTNAPIAQTVNITSQPGIFACGNCFKVYDLADTVVEDAYLCGRQAAEYIRSAR